MNSLMIKEPRHLEEGFSILNTYLGFLNVVNSLLLHGLQFSVDRFCTYRKGNFSKISFMVSMEKGIPISFKLSRVL